jgi:hypothetical protein
MGHYFISYSRRDFYFAESLFYALHSKRINAWMDVWNITPGDDWDNAFTSAIESCDGLILVATKDSLRSPYVRHEIRQAYQLGKPILLLIRGRVSKRDLVIPAENPQGQFADNLDLSSYSRVIVDMRADFAQGIETLAGNMYRSANHKDTIPHRFSLKTERIFYLPPVLVVLVLFMVVTEISTYGIQAFYSDQVPQLMAYIRDIVHGAIGETLFLVPLMYWAVVSFIALVGVLVISVNLSRRKRVNAAQFYLLLLSAGLVAGTILLKDLIAVLYDYVDNVSTPVSVYVRPGEHTPSVGHAAIILLVVHGIAALFFVILSQAFLVMFHAQKGRGAVLRWLPTGWASEGIRREGNEQWTAKLPDILVSPAPSLNKTYGILASPEDGLAADEVREILRRNGYLITDNHDGAECLLVLLSPFSDRRPLQPPMSAGTPRSVIYVVARSIRTPRDLDVTTQWIDYRRSSPDQFEQQWERRFTNLKRAHSVLPYVPEALGNPTFPRATSGRVAYNVVLMMCAMVVSSAILFWELEFAVFVRKSIGGLLLPICLACLLGAVGLTYYAVTQILREMTSVAQVRRWLAIAGILAMVVAFATQNPRTIIETFVIVVVNAIIVTRVTRVQNPRTIIETFVIVVVNAIILTRRVTRRATRATRATIETIETRGARGALYRWLPPTLRTSSQRSTKKRPLRPISNLRVILSPAGLFVILGFLVANAWLTNSNLVPYLRPPSASMPYTVAVPGPYYLAAPGLWAQDPYAGAFGYHFTYRPDQLEISEDEANGYITWLRFYSVGGAPMRFASHFRSSIHIHFTNSDVRTSVSVGLNGQIYALTYDPLGDSRGPLLLLAPSGGMRVIESNYHIFDGQLSQSEISHDYTLGIEVNGTSCTYTINGNAVITFTDPSAATVKDIMFTVESYVPGGMKLTLSDFTYTPVPDPLLGQEYNIRPTDLHP